MTTAPELAEAEIGNMLKGFTIPSPPQIIADLQMEMAMPDPSLSSISNLITKDAALAGSVLKIMNSPFYGIQSINSIQQAVMMLGTNTVMNLVNAVQLRETSIYANDMTDENQAAYNRFWDSAEDVARCCMLISQRLGFMDSDLAYMLGLFHNAGIPLLMLKHPDYLSVVAESYQCNEGRVIDTENNTLDTNHAVIGYYVARSWKLPDIITHVIAAHHNGSIVFTDKAAIKAEKVSYFSVLKMAEHIAGLYTALGNHETDPEWLTIREKVLDYLGLSESEYDDLVAEAKDQSIGNYAGSL